MKSDADPGTRPDERSGGEVHLDEWISPEIADEHGDVRAGKILEWMDVVGVLAATRHCRRMVVTASVDGLEMSHSIRVGERVTMTASVAYTSPRSIGVSVSMRHGLPHLSEPLRSLSGYMTFVALDDAGKALEVPQFRPETPSEILRFREGQLRSEFRKKMTAGELPALDGTGEAFAPGPERTVLIRELLKMLPRSFKLPFDFGDRVRPRDRHLSYVHKIEPVHVSRLNFHGTLYGGTLMRWIESCAQLSARAYLAGAPVRLSGLHGLTFIRPVEQNVFVHIRSMIVHTAEASLTALVTVDAEDPMAGTRAETLRAFLTYEPVAKVHAERLGVAPLDCAREEETALFKEVEHRLALQRTILGTEEEARDANRAQPFARLWKVAT
jgi:acyl-CoA hydrolase